MRPPAACRFVFDGQSRVNAPPWEGGAFGWSWPRLAVAGLGVPAYDHPAIGGTSLTTLATDFNTRCAPWIAPASLEPTIYVLCGGFTDYHGEGNSGAQVYADAWALADMARAAGAVYVVCTTTIGATVFDAGMEAARQAGNALILADSMGKFDATVDFEVSGLDDPADTDSFLDGIHIWGGPDRTKGTWRAGAVARPVLVDAVAAVTGP